MTLKKMSNKLFICSISLIFASLLLAAISVVLAMLFELYEISITIAMIGLISEVIGFGLYIVALVRDPYCDLW